MCRPSCRLRRKRGTKECLAEPDRDPGSRFRRQSRSRVQLAALFPDARPRRSSSRGPQLLQLSSECELQSQCAVGVSIGVIGTGNRGGALGLRWTHCGHAGLCGSGDPAKARALASNAGPGSTRVGSFDDAVSFGEVVFYTVRDVLPSPLLREPKGLFGKVVIDCSNSAIL